MLSKSWQWLACILQPAEHHPSPIELATIHATILAILMGVLSAYFIYIYGEIRSARSEVMRGAEEINKIVFRRSSYHPSDEDVYQVTGPEDMDRLKKSLWKLMYLSPNEVIPPDPEEVAAVPEEPSKRAKRFLEILNVVIHQYPFPRAIEVTSKGCSWFPAEPLLFTDFEVLRQWLKDMGDVIGWLTSMADSVGNSNQMRSWLQTLSDEERGGVKRIIFGNEREPLVIADDFVSGIVRVHGVYNSTLTAFNRAESMKSNSISKPYSVATLLGGLGIFVVGVLVPILTGRPNPLLYIYLPFIYYGIISIAAISKVFRL